MTFKIRENKDGTYRVIYKGIHEKVFSHKDKYRTVERAEAAIAVSSFVALDKWGIDLGPIVKDE